MNFKKILLILTLAMVFCLAIGGVNALKITYANFNEASRGYSDGVEMSIYSKGYTYHSGDIHKHVKTKKDLRPICYNGHNKKCKYYGRTSLGMWYVEGKVSELKKVSYGSIKINGKYSNKKIKLVYGNDVYGISTKFPKFHTTNIKGNLKGKTITLNAHNKNGKIICSKSFKVRHTTKYNLIGA